MATQPRMDKCMDGCMAWVHGVGVAWVRRGGLRDVGWLWGGGQGAGAKAGRLEAWENDKLCAAEHVKTSLMQTILSVDGHCTGFAMSVAVLCRRAWMWEHMEDW